MIEYVIGGRMSGKTTDIINQLNNYDEIGIIVKDSITKEYYKKLVTKELFLNRHIRNITKTDNKINNITIITKPHQLYGCHFDKVFIDDASYIDYESFVMTLKDCMRLNGKIYIYLTALCNDFSVRVLKKNILP